MAFNHAKFNRNPFNTPGELLRWLKVTGVEQVDTSIGSALNYYALAIGNERVNKAIDGVKAYFTAATFSETISENVSEVQLSVILYPTFEENVTEETTIAAEIYPDISGFEEITNVLVSNVNLCLVSDLTEEVNANIASGVELYISADGYELVSESASLENITTKVCVLNATLQPGEILIIDANTYNVLLNQQNAIDIHSGDWIDELNRNTTELKISAASGVSNLSATILYTERYL